MEHDKSIVSLKSETEDFGVEFEVLPAIDSEDINRINIRNSLKEIDDRVQFTRDKIIKLNEEIDRLTNQADVVDYTIAVTCGLIAGMLDMFFVGEWDFKQAKDKSNEEVNNKVIEFAKRDPRYEKWCIYTEKGNIRKNPKDENRLATAVEFLEEMYILPGDSEWDIKKQIIDEAKKRGFGGRGYDEAVAYLDKVMPQRGGWRAFRDELKVTQATHHLDDFCHHPTLVGLVCSVLVQFTGEAKYTDRNGRADKFRIKINEYGKFVSDDKYGKIFAGVINWFFCVAKTMANQRGHLYSDMAGSLNAIKKDNLGAGIPGSFVSIAKELASLEIFKDTNFNENLRKAYQNGIGAGKNQLDLGFFNSLFEGAQSKVDLRTELAVASELKRQSVPVIINEILVRCLYFIRRFVEQLKVVKTVYELDFEAMLPIRNRTIERMMTVATGTFTAFDLADAAIETAVKNPESCTSISSFMSKMILRVNFVGVGRFSVAIVTDASMGIIRGLDINERIRLCQEQIEWSKAKVYYKEADMWISVRDAGEALREVYYASEEATQFYYESIKAISDDVEVIQEYLPSLVEDDPLFAAEIKNILI